MLQNLQWDSFEQRRARSRVLMLYHIWNGLVPIPASIHFLPATVCTRGFETKYWQIQCNTSAHSQTFIPSAIRLWSTFLVDICQLSPDSFKAQLSTIQLMWIPASLVFNPLYCTVFICSCVIFICTTVFYTVLPRHTPGPTLRYDITRLRVGTLLGRWWRRRYRNSSL